jgi:hypothetical protein
MGRWKIKNCLKCGGSTFLDRDMDGWYEQCINCSFRRELRVDVINTKEVMYKKNVNISEPVGQLSVDI